jgi:PGF-CTERM protein
LGLVQVIKMLKTRNRNKKSSVNRLMSKGLIFSTLVMLFVATASIGIVAATEEGETHIITLDCGYPFVPTCLPSLSPDWEKVAFSTYEDLGNGSAKLTLWVVNMDGCDMKKLDERIENQSSDMISFDMIVGWSPDGENILNWKVYMILGGMVGELWIITSDGVDKKQLVEGIQPSDVIWSPSGDKITYTEGYYTTKFLDNVSHTETTTKFYVVDINENTNTLITDGTPLLWTTDEEIIYYKKEFMGKGDDIHYTTWKIDLNRAIPTKLGSINTTPSEISPDGSKIAYRNHGIWVVNIDGSDLRQLTVSDGDHHSSPIWSPDGKRIAFLSWMGAGGIEEGIWVINSDGSDQKKLTSVTPTYGWGLWGQVWNKESSKIAYANNDWVNLTNDIYIIDVGEPPSITPPIGQTPTEEEPGFEAITPTSAPTPTPEEGVPGFEAVFSIAGLLVVADLLRRRK